MAGETPITLIGNLVEDPELRFTPAGAAVANLNVASTPRTFDKDTNEFKDGETLFIRGSVWREQAENVAETLQKGMRVIVVGNLKARSYETKEGDKRTVMELDIQEVGPALRYATAKVQRTQKGGQQGGQGSRGGFQGQQSSGGFQGGQNAWSGQQNGGPQNWQPQGGQQGPPF